MKKFFLLSSVVFLSLFSCSPSDPDNETDPETDTDSEFAMTAKINGEVFQANNPYGTNEFSSSTIWNYYPTEEFILLQGRQGVGFIGREINLWLKVSDIAVGSYEIGKETFDVKPSHYVSYINATSFEGEYTNEGKIVITNVNTNTKVVEGTFEFTTIPEVFESTAPVNNRITDGKFRYTYE